MRHIISLGAGVQSSTMALMAAAGELTPMPECAIFADTQNEPKSVYEWLLWLESQLPFPVHRVTRGNLRDEMLRVRVSGKSGRPYLKHHIPVFTHTEHPSKGEQSYGVMQRQCSSDFKITPIIQKLRKMGYKKTGVTQWIGISLDEVGRMRPSRVDWIRNAYPLIEKNITRDDCIAWMKSRGYPEPPRSACIFCPYHEDAVWDKLKRESPEEFASAVQTERDLQSAFQSIPRLSSVPYLHKSRVNLDSVTLNPSEKKRGKLIQPGLQFNNECEGVCGV